MRNLTLLLTLSLLLVHVSPSCGDWFYDFDDGIIPDTFITESFDDSLVIPTETLQVSADDGELRMWDSSPTSSGGTKVAAGYNDEVFDGGVRISAKINSSEDTDDSLGLSARVSDLLTRPPPTVPRSFLTRIVGTMDGSTSRRMCPTRGARTSQQLGKYRPDFKATSWRWKS